MPRAIDLTQARAEIAAIGFRRKKKKKKRKGGIEKPIRQGSWRKQFHDHVDQLINKTPTRLTLTQTTKDLQDTWPKIYPRSQNPNQKFTRSWTKESDRYRRQIETYFGNLLAKGELTRIKEEVKDRITGETQYYKKRWVYTKKGHTAELNIDWSAEDFVGMIQVVARPSDELEGRIIEEILLFTVGSHSIAEWCRMSANMAEKVLSQPDFLAKIFPAVVPAERLHRLKVHIDGYISQLRGELQLIQ